MTARKRNDWLEAELSDEEDKGYDSEAAEDSRLQRLGGRATKRRKVDSELGTGSASEENEDVGEDEVDRKPPEEPVIKAAQDQDDVASAQQSSAQEASPNPLKPLTPKQLAASQKKASRTGVIYLSRVPPFMKPQTVRHLLEPYGPIGRIFLTPEDPAVHTRRVKAGGNKKRSFTDGWVEFISKKDAKLVAESLNAQIIGGKKGGWYHDDVWNIKYLKGFKWHHLTEQIANENAERAARMRAEIAQTTRENKLFLANVEKAKMLEGMEAKRRKKRAGQEGDNVSTDAAVVGTVEESKGGRDGRGFRRQFKQNEVKLKTVKDKGRAEQPEGVKRVLSKIF